MVETNNPKTPSVQSTTNEPRHDQLSAEEQRVRDQQKADAAARQKQAEGQNAQRTPL